MSCLTYFYLTRFPTAKSEFQTRFETRSRYSHKYLIQGGGTGGSYLWVVDVGDETPYGLGPGGVPA